MYRVMILLSALLIPFMLSAKGPHGEGPEGHGPGGPKHGKGGMFFKEEMLEQLGVSDAVRADIRKLMHETKKKAMDVQYKVKEEMLVLKEEAEKTNPDKNKMLESAKKIAELRKEQVLLMETSKIDILFKLTPDQRKKCIQIMQDHRKKMMEQFGGEGPEND